MNTIATPERGAKNPSNLDAFPDALNTAFQRFEDNGISQEDLDRIKAGYEVQFYGQLENALGKAILLGQYNALSGDPARINSDVQKLQAVTTEDVMRVYNSYIKDRPYITTSIVPKGQLELALTGSQQAEVVEEAIVNAARQFVDQQLRPDFVPGVTYIPPSGKVVDGDDCAAMVDAAAAAPPTTAPFFRNSRRFIMFPIW